MIVYRQQQRLVETRALVRNLSRQVDDLSAVVTPRHDGIVGALVDAGELASAVADAHATERDVIDPSSRQLLQIACLLAKAADASWRGAVGDVTARVSDAAVAISRVGRLSMPSKVQQAVSEGFAYYGLGPELYAEAARGWAATARPHTVWCVGLRTIGLPLAASAAAALENSGVDARVISLRPRGHPFARCIVADRSVAVELMSTPHPWYLVIDEGPGISGSSMAGTAEWLSSLGATDDRIVLMPAYQPRVEAFDERERQRWQRHRVHAADFEATWIASRRLSNEWSSNRITDLGGGRWRSFVSLGGEPPATNPQHERRKYRVRRGENDCLLKFAGHGRYARKIAARADGAAAAGWSPPALEIRGGWSVFGWRDEHFGIDPSSTTDLEQLASYLAFVARSRACGEAAEPSALLEMAVTNTRAACGDEAAGMVERLQPRDTVAAVDLDGHLRAHEWYHSNNALQKTDGVEHGDDHFFPGPTDIAWDLGSAIEEWTLDDAAARFVIDRYISASGDVAVRRRLPFYRAAYLAFRVGYTAMSRDQLRDTPEAVLFDREHRFYKRRLAAVTV
jgi:hypothetical protein